MVVRHLLPDDMDLLHGWLGGDAFSAYRPYLLQLCPTLPDMQQRSGMLTQFEPPVEIEVMVLHRPTGTPIGAMSLSAIDHFNRKAEFSFGFVRGIGTRCVSEALHFALDSAFSAMNLNKLIFYVAENNLAMLEAARRYQFIHEGLLREELLLENGARINLHRYALLQKDWTHNPLRLRLLKLAPLP